MAKASETENKVFIPVEDRPRCIHRGCKVHGAHTGNYRKDGTPLFRKLCTKHHNVKTAKKYGLKNIAEVMATKAGFDSVADFLNSTHPYRKHRKDYCENRDGRLSFKCRYKIRHSSQLEVDHINGKPWDQRKINLQTLCSNCHTYKTHANKDYATPGRKSNAQSQKGMFSRLVGKI